MAVIGETSGLDVNMTPDVAAALRHGRVIQFAEVPWDLALDLVSWCHGFRYTVANDGITLQLPDTAHTEIHDDIVLGATDRGYCLVRPE